MVFDYLTLQELIKIRGLNWSFAKLLKSGAVPSVFEINSETFGIHSESNSYLKNFREVTNASILI